MTTFQTRDEANAYALANSASHVIKCDLASGKEAFFAAKAPAEVLRRQLTAAQMRTLGIRHIIGSSIADDTSAADDAWAHVGSLRVKADAARTGSGEYDYSRSIDLDARADAAERAFAQQYPGEYAAIQQSAATLRARQSAERMADYEASFAARNID